MITIKSILKGHIDGVCEKGFWISFIDNVSRNKKSDLFDERFFFSINDVNEYDREKIRVGAYIMMVEGAKREKSGHVYHFCTFRFINTDRWAKEELDCARLILIEWHDGGMETNKSE